jgi:dihydroorotate dehydrogenase electron transfer subunit
MNVEDAYVLKQTSMTAEYRVLRLSAPVIASSVRPGQFVHVRIPRLELSVLRRPFSVYRAEGETLSILYKTVGAGTRVLNDIRAGDRVSLIGPLGNGFPEPAAGQFPVLVAGGYGVAPLFMLASRGARRGIVFIGGASAKDVLCAEDFRKLDWEVRIATEDGSLGTRGRVTASLDPWLAERKDPAPPEFFACGPDGLLKAIGDRAIAGNWRAWLSLDKHMGCGVGACLACVQKIRDANGNVEWKRVCKDGPVFEAREIVWT